MAISASFVWGILSVLLSPCHLTSIPLIVGFIDDQDNLTVKRGFMIALLFALGNLENTPVGDLAGDQLALEDRWILSRLARTIDQATGQLEEFKFSEPINELYRFFWNDFCDWYIEASKSLLYSNSLEDQNRAVTLLLDILAESMRLMHPFLSFVTEEVYQKLPNTVGYVIGDAYPRFHEDRKFPEAEAKFSLFQEVVRKVRTLKSEFSLPPEKKVRIMVKADNNLAELPYLIEQRELIARFVNASEVLFHHETPVSLTGSVPVAGEGFEVFVFVRDAIDVPQELAKLKKEREKAARQLDAAEKKLGNSKFLESAPPAVIEKERGKRDEFSDLLEKIDRHVEELSR